MPDVPEDIRKMLAEKAGPLMLAFVTSIRTRYVDQTHEEHSGTGLLLTSGPLDTYCLTANHVVTPSSRVPSDRREVVQHSYVENMGRVDGSGRIIKDDDSPIPPPFRLRRKYFKSETLDLAMLASSLNGYELTGIKRANYYPYRYIANARLHSVVDEDVFATCGFPSTQTTSLPAMRLTNYSPLLHLFTGAQWANHASDVTRYTLEYADRNPLPHGLSGAPVWLIRDSTSESTPLNPDRVRALSADGRPVRFTFSFGGILVSHDPSAARLQAVRPEVCAKFAADFERSKPDLNDETEDQVIKEQLGYWMERYGDRWSRN